MSKKRLPRETIIKFEALCVCVENPEKFIKNLNGLCEYYSVKGSEPLIIYKTEEGKIIRNTRKGDGK